METERLNLPKEAIELYNSYIHGDISRRDFMDGVKRFAVGGLAAGRASSRRCMPNYAAAQQVSKTDDAHQGRVRDRAVAAGQRRPSRATWSRPSAQRATTKLPGILVVHENRGLNPHIEDIARRLALANFMAFAPDGLTSVGGYPGDDDKGGSCSARSTAPR